MIEIVYLTKRLNRTAYYQEKQGIFKVKVKVKLKKFLVLRKTKITPIEDKKSWFLTLMWVFFLNRGTFLILF